MTTTNLLRIIPVLALATGALTLRAAQPVRVHVSGAVVDSAGKPLAGAVVEGYESEGSIDDAKLLSRLTTGADGAFQFESGAMRFVILARKAGLAPAWVQQWSSSKDQTNLLLTLAAPEPVEGKVIDETGKPVANAEVRVSLALMERPAGNVTYIGYMGGKQAQELFSTRTSTDGRFRLENFPAGASADLEVQVPGRVLRPLEREYLGSDNMRCSSGQTNVELAVEPAGTIEGKVAAEGTRQPLAGASFRAVPTRSGISGSSERFSAVSDANGRFRLADLAACDYTLLASFGTNEPPEWVAETVLVSVEVRQTNRDVTIIATRGGVLEVSVLRQEDRKPATEVNVSVYLERYNASAKTDAGGIARLRLPPGEYHVQAYLSEARSESTTTEVAAGKTNRLELVLAPPPKITGVVRNSAGAPVSGIKVTLHGWNGPDGNVTQSDTSGRFELPWSAGRSSSDRQFCVVARDAARNLVASETLDEGITNLALRLEPGLTIAGSIQDPAGKPLTNGTVELHIRLGNYGMQFEPEPTPADTRGRFQVSGLPTDHEFYFYVNAKGYGSTNLTIPADSETNRLDFEPFVLRPANLRIAGQVLDAEEKPAARAWVNAYGPGQPNNSGRADGQGRFSLEVCEGQVQLYANVQRSSGSAVVQAGETNLILKLGENQGLSGIESSVARRPALKGKPLPGLTGLAFAADAVPAGKPVLLCVFDLEQRPSRRLAKQLADQHQVLRQKDVVVLGLQAAVLTPESLKELKDAAQLPFPVGNVGEKAAQPKWVSGINSLPWLILTDATRTVVDEGFAVEDLEGKLKAIGR